MNYQALSESELLRLVRVDARCIDELLRRYEPMVGKMAQSFAPNDAERYRDEGRNALVDAAMHYDPARGTRFAAYAYVCVRHRMSRCSRRQAHMDALDADAPSLDPSPEERLLAEEAFALTNRRAKQCLSRFEYAVWRMRIDGYTYAEIAFALSKPQRPVNVKSVGNALVRVRNKMRGKND